MATLKELADTMQRFEGYLVHGSRAQRNNNPGNLRFANQAGATGKDENGYAIFDSPESGRTALEHQIGLDASRGLTLSSFIAKYAPPNENNTSNYLQFVSNQTGIAPSETLQSGFRRG